MLSGACAEMEESHAMPITLTVFAASPDEGRGLARDMGVRWAGV